MDEEELIRLVQQGNDSAFNDLRMRYMGMMFRYINRYRARLEISAEDLLQETSIALYETARDYSRDREKEFSYYASFAIRNCVTNYVRLMGSSVHFSQGYFNDKAIIQEYRKGKEEGDGYSFQEGMEAGLTAERSKNLLEGYPLENVLPAYFQRNGDDIDIYEVFHSGKSVSGYRFSDLKIDLNRYLAGLEIDPTIMEKRMSAFILVAMEGYAISEASERLGVSEITMSDLVYKARKMLKKALTDLEERG